MPNMKQLKYGLMVIIMMWCGALMFTSCSADDAPDEAEPQEEIVPVPTPRVISKHYVEKSKMTVYNIEYPSTDPFGNPVMLSGTITMGDEVNATTPARGLVLYNHFTVFRADQCPSKGDLNVQQYMCGSGLITVSADYYGFGITEDKLQAYCVSKANAQASVDALLAAKKLLRELGYSWNDDILFNAGYSQGGQTSMAVVRLIDEKYPDLHITYTFAGGGPYDIPQTYRDFIETDITGMPTTVISVLLAYNEYCSLGIPRSELFIEPTLSHIDEWIISKKYTNEEINEKVGSQHISDFATPIIINLESAVSKRLLEVLEKDNLCKGWKPRKDEHILLVHNTSDITVPPSNTVNMAAFLKEQGVKDVTVVMDDYGKLFGQPAHETGAVIFTVNAILQVCKTLDIKLWFNLSDLDLFK